MSKERLRFAKKIVGRVVLLLGNVMMKNPVQRVLEAEAEASASIESARHEAAAKRHAAHADARAIIEHNETRTQRAIKRYEESCATRLAMQVETLDTEAQAANERFVNLVDEHVDEIIEESFASLWPQLK